MKAATQKPIGIESPFLACSSPFLFENVACAPSCFDIVVGLLGIVQFPPYMMYMNRNRILAIHKGLVRPNPSGKVFCVDGLAFVLHKNFENDKLHVR